MTQPDTSLRHRIDSILGRNCPAIGGVSAEGINVIRELGQHLADTLGIVDDLMAMIYEGVPKEEWPEIQAKAKAVVAKLKNDFRSGV